MGLDYPNLDEATRASMTDEVQFDIANGSLYLSTRLNPQGTREWPDLLLSAVETGNDDSLAAEVVSRELLKSHEESQRNGRPYTKKVPSTAAVTLAEGEFNRFYLRGIAARAVEEGREVEIYRGRESASPRAESQELVGNRLAGADLLNDLRSNVGVDSALKLPPGPNSGLTGKLV
ncbi:hypothetical protein [Arthrobacter sp. BPSS-3]|uniref:hypothetical protein n=1 Tax=Arthrobacter sp. BPSS-3 TaxID=3366580 RepID=UPI0037DD665E